VVLAVLAVAVVVVVVEHQQVALVVLVDAVRYKFGGLHNESARY